MTKEHRQLIEDKINHIKANPDQHRHTHEGLQRCCMIGGVLNARAKEAHTLYVTANETTGL